MAEALDRRAECQPFDCGDILHQLVAWLGFRPHEPELHYLRPAAHLVRHDAEKLTYLYPEPGFFHDLASCARDGTLVSLELAAGQHPELVLAALNDGHPWPRAAAHRYSTYRVYRPTHKTNPADHCS